MKEVFPGIYKIKSQFATKNLVKGKSVYGEKRVTMNNKEYRIWDPERSKPCSAFKNRLKTWPMQKDSKVLYLGISEGTTASHFSDILTDGIIFGVDIATKTFQKLLQICEKRENIIPILANANNPEEYQEYIEEKVDVIYQDISQKNQTEILIKNAEKYLKPEGYLIYAIKTLNINSVGNPEQIVKQEVAKLKNSNFKIIAKISLEPFHKGHFMIIAHSNS